MDDKKTSSYIKYAIGEIFLVVIGILLAIQLDEWRNSLSNQNQKLNVLHSLAYDFQSNLTQLDTVLLYQSKVSDAYLLANKMIQDPKGNFSDDTISKMLSDFDKNWTFNPQNGALRSAISSNDIHLIADKNLIKRLFSWEDLVKDSEEESNRALKFQYDSYELLSKYVRISEMWKHYDSEIIQRPKSSDFQALLKDIRFEDYSTLRYSYNKEYLDELNIIRNINIEIIELISKELAK